MGKCMKHTVLALAISAGLLTLVSTQLSQAAEKAPVATIVSTKGPVMVRGTDGKTRSVKVGEPLFEGEKLQTMTQATTTIRMSPLNVWLIDLHSQV